MKYVKFVFSNGYCGCDEEYYYAFDNSITDEALSFIFEDHLNSYSFLDPDDRFCDCDNDAEVADYCIGVEEHSYWEKISKEEWEENNGEKCY